MALRTAECSHHALQLDTRPLTAAGWGVQLFTQICIVILMLGTNIGGLVQCGEIFSSAAFFISGNVPNWIAARSGSVLMVVTTIFIFPCCLVELMTQVRKRESLMDGVLPLAGFHMQH